MDRREVNLEQIGRAFGAAMLPEEPGEARPPIGVYASDHVPATLLPRVKRDTVSLYDVSGNEVELSYTQQLQLDLASQGLTQRQAAKMTNYVEATVGSQRGAVMCVLGAKTMSEAVRLASESHMFDRQLFDDYSHIKSLPGRLVTELNLVAHGLKAFSATKHRGVPLHIVNSDRAEVKRRLSARNLPHAVRIAYEAGVLPLQRP